MASFKLKQTLPPSTEDKIRNAAHAVFRKKGYAATRTRDIAEAANINLALLNYYFRSKEKLFEEIMLETVVAFMGTIEGIFQDESTSLDEKIELLVVKYIDQLIAEPELPIFVMSELRSEGGRILEKLPLAKSLMQSAFIRQYKEAVAKGTIVEPNPVHFVMNIMGLVVFPFIQSPLLKMVGKLSDRQFIQLMKQRKKTIPIWLRAILKAG